jgi:hypothetical protein
MRTSGKIAIIGVCIAAAVVIALLLMRGSLSKKVYDGTGATLAGRLSPELREKYGEELRYTLDKFWSCYEDDIVSRNDLNDVMDRMRILTDRDAVDDEEVFEFIGFVSRIYTDAIHEHHRRTMPEEPPLELILD